MNISKFFVLTKDFVLPRVDIFMLVLATCILVSANLRSDAISSPDTRTYSAWADLLLHHRFNYFAYYRDNDFLAPSFLYTVPVTVIALLKYAGSDWTSYFFGLNLAALTASMLLFQKTARLLGVRAPIVALSLGMFLISVDHLLWPHYVLTDTIFTAFVGLTIFVVIRNISEGAAFTPLLLLCLLMVLLTRPTSVPVVAAFAISVVLTNKAFVIGKWLSLGGICITIAVSAFAYGILMDVVLSGGIQNRQLLFMAEMVSKGVVIHDRPDTFVTMAPGTWEVSKLFLLRFWTFFSPLASTFSTLHNLLNLALFGFIFCSFAVWLFAPHVPDSRLRSGAIVMLVLVTCVALFHSATLIDFDWRYRYPMIAPLLLFSAIGLEQGLRAVSVRIHGTSGSKKKRSDFN